MSSNVTFIKQKGRLKRTIPGQDYISAFIFYGLVPSGFSPNHIQQIFSVTDAEALGIHDDYRDATAANATYTVTVVGANGDTLNIKVTEPLGVVVDLGTYTKVSGDTTVTNVASAIKNIINSGTVNHGYSASNASGVLTITAPKRLGIFLNSGTPITVTLSSGATIAGTLVQFTGGVASKQAILHYHISEYFRIQSGTNGTDGLYVACYAAPGSYDFSEINLVQNYSGGKVRLFGIFKDSGSAWAAGDLGLIDTACKAQDSLIKNCSALYAADISGTADITTITDLNTLTANKASSIVGQDAAALGNYLFLTTGKSITQLGAALGALSVAAVSEDFGNVIDKFNMSAGAGLENDVVAFANGQLIGTLGNSVVDSIDAKRHIFLKKYQGVTGSYFNDNHTAIIASDDYAYINDNRVIDTAERNIYASIIPALKGRLYLNSNGTMTQSTIENLRSLTLKPLYDMNRNGDLSDIDPEDVYINPTQNVKVANSVTIEVSLNEAAIARNIVIPIGFKS